MLSLSQKRCGDEASPIAAKTRLALLLAFDEAFLGLVQDLIDLVGDCVQRFAQRFVFLYQFFSRHVFFHLLQEKGFWIS